MNSLKKQSPLKVKVEVAIDTVDSWLADIYNILESFDNAPKVPSAELKAIRVDFKKIVMKAARDLRIIYGDVEFIRDFEKLNPRQIEMIPQNISRELFMLTQRICRSHDPRAQKLESLIEQKFDLLAERLAFLEVFGKHPVLLRLEIPIKRFADEMFCSFPYGSIVFDPEGKRWEEYWGMVFDNMGLRGQALIHYEAMKETNRQILRRPIRHIVEYLKPLSRDDYLLVADKIRDIKSDFSKNIYKMLFVKPEEINGNFVKNLPEYDNRALISQSFEKLMNFVIELVYSVDCLPRDIVNYLEILEVESKFEEAAEGASKQPTDRKTGITYCQTPPRTSWEDLLLEIDSLCKLVTIKVNGKKIEKIEYTKMGFPKGRKDELGAWWKWLLDNYEKLKKIPQKTDIREKIPYDPDLGMGIRDYSSKSGKSTSRSYKSHVEDKLKSYFKNIPERPFDSFGRPRFILKRKIPKD